MKTAFIDLMRRREIEKRLDPALLANSCLLCSEHQPHHCHRRLTGGNGDPDDVNLHWSCVSLGSGAAIQHGHDPNREVASGLSFATSGSDQHANGDGSWSARWVFRPIGGSGRMSVCELGVSECEKQIASYRNAQAGSIRWKARIHPAHPQLPRLEKLLWHEWCRLFPERKPEPKDRQRFARLLTDWLHDEQDILSAELLPGGMAPAER